VDLPLLKKTRQVQQARQRYCVHCSVWWRRRTVAAHPMAMAMAMAMATASEEAKAGVHYHSLNHVSPLQPERQIQRWRWREHLDLQREG
jgi:hypothetical protein